MEIIKPTELELLKARKIILINSIALQQDQLSKIDSRVAELEPKV